MSGISWTTAARPPAHKYKNAAAWSLWWERQGELSMPSSSTSKLATSVTALPAASERSLGATTNNVGVLVFIHIEGVDFFSLRLVIKEEYEDLP
jgi:hypothetical protein